MPEETSVDGSSQAHSVALDSTESSGLGTQSDQSARESESQGSGEGNNQAPNGKKAPSAYYQYRQAKKAFKAEQEAFAREREAFARERAQLEESKKPKRDYSLADLQKYRKQWDREGNYELVEAADKEIAAMEAEEKASKRTVDLPVQGTLEHKTQWEAAERELVQADPEFMREGTRLDSKLRTIMGSEDGNIYRQHPRGIVAAYHRAKMELLEEDKQGLQTELGKYKAELQRLTGLTSIDGGAPGRMGNGSRVESVDDFARLKTQDMRKHLIKTAQRGSTPWF